MPPTDRKRGFFEALPPELRIRIYDLLYREVEGIHGDDDGNGDGSCEYRITIPLVALRLVSRKFKHEYDDRRSTMQQFLMKGIHHSWRNRYDHDDDDDDDEEYGNGNEMLRPFETPRIGRHATNMTVVLSACGCQGKRDCSDTWFPCGDFEQDWIERLVEQQSGDNLHRARIYLTIPAEKCVERVLQHMDSIAMHHGRLATSKVSDIFEVVLLYPGCNFGDGGRDRRLATWTKIRGLEIEDQAVMQTFKTKSPEEVEMEWADAQGKGRAFARWLAGTL